VFFEYQNLQAFSCRVSAIDGDSDRHAGRGWSDAAQDISEM